MEVELARPSAAGGGDMDLQLARPSAAGGGAMRMGVELARPSAAGEGYQVLELARPSAAGSGAMGMGMKLARPSAADKGNQKLELARPSAAGSGDGAGGRLGVFHSLCMQGVLAQLWHHFAAAVAHLSLLWPLAPGVKTVWALWLVAASKRTSSNGVLNTRSVVRAWRELLR